MEMQIKTRDELPFLLKKLKLDGKGVEIGVQKGDYSLNILENSNLSVLFSVDPWIEFESDKYQDGSNVNQEMQDYRYLKTIMKLMKFKTRSVCLRMTSENASSLFKEDDLDFVYIDGNHSYENTKKDIELWWLKLKKGGLFAGHDYYDEDNLEAYGVKKAVDEFIKEKNLKLFVTDEKWPSWYLVK